jgi:hypothetical protein
VRSKSLWLRLARVLGRVEPVTRGDELAHGRMGDIGVPAIGGRSVVHRDAGAGRQHAGGKTVEGKPKTRSGEDRRVDIGQRVVGALLAHRLAREVERAMWASGYTDGDRVFARGDGTDLSPQSVTKAFGRLLYGGGRRPIRLHDLRHGAASLMLAGGADIVLVSKRLGHSSIRITADTYSHLLEEAGRQAGDAAEGLVRPRATTSVPDAPPHIAPTEAEKENCGSPVAGEPAGRCLNQTRARRDSNP